MRTVFDAMHELGQRIFSMGGDDHVDQHKLAEIIMDYVALCEDIKRLQRAYEELKSKELDNEKRV